jgi:hypothetical protein
VPVRAVSSAVAVLAAVCFLAGCGGGGGNGPSNNLDSPNAPLANVQHRARAADPDSSIVGGTDATTVLTSLGNGRYQLDVQNLSSIGGIDSFLWQAPVSMTITGVTGSSTGTCTLLTDYERTKVDSVPYGIGEISCNGVRLKAPTCTCKPGGSMSVKFTAKVEAEKGTTTGAAFGTLKIEELTPVPYIIPSTPNQQPNADLPTCKKGQTTGCVPAG